jgi:hypothetical protein
MMFAGRPELVGGRILSGKRGPGYSRLPPAPAVFLQFRTQKLNTLMRLLALQIVLSRRAFLLLTTHNLHLTWSPDLLIITIEQ